MLELQAIQVKELREQLDKCGDENYISVVVVNQSEEKACKVTHMGVVVDEKLDEPILAIFIDGEVG